MELRRAAEVLIRARNIPTTTLLNSAISTSQTASSLRCRAWPRPSLRTPTLSRRTLSTSAPSRADDPSPNPVSPPPTSSPSDDYDAALNSLLDFTPQRYTGAQGETRSPLGASLSFTSPSTSSSSPSSYSSADHMRALFTRDTEIRTNRTRTPRVDTSRMAMPRRSPSPGPPPPPAIPENPPPILRLGPSVGRTVTVDKNRGMDLARSFQVLEINCARNYVRRDFGSQRFHERPGLRRKRLHSQRWRQRFKVGFQAVVAKVDKMRRQGW